MARPADLAAPIAPGILERKFSSPWDGTEQSYLEKNFGGGDLTIICLHGAASHQDQGMTAGIYGNAFGHWAGELSRRGALYICPEYRGGSWMGPAAEADVREILRRIRGSGFGGKIFLVGGSMGGTAALIFASRFPEEIDGVFAMCPATDVIAMFPRFSEQFLSSYGGSPDEIPQIYTERCSRNFTEALARLPIFFVHGTDDALIPVEHSRILATRLRERNARFRYVELPGGDHDAPIAFPLPEALHFLEGKKNSAKNC